MATASDNFNRANAATLGANWANALNVNSPLTINTNQAGGAGGTVFGAEIWSANSFGSNQFSKATFTGVSDNQMCVMVRAQASTNDNYLGGLIVSTDATHYVMFKVVAGVSTQLGTTSSTVVTINDVVEMDANGTTISLIVNGLTIISVTDSSLSGGSPGLRQNISGAAAPLFDNWSGGDLSVSGGNSNKQRRMELLYQ